MCVCGWPAMAAQDVQHIRQLRVKVTGWRCATAMVRAGLFVEVSTAS